jgi:hypothetical protein
MLHFEFEKLSKGKQFKILNKVKLNFNKQMNYTITNHDLMIEKDKFTIIWKKRRQPKAFEKIYSGYKFAAENEIISILQKLRILSIDSKTKTLKTNAESYYFNQILM